MTTTTTTCQTQSSFRITRKRTNKTTSKATIVCWHCGATGHEKKTCLTFHLERAMIRLLPNVANPHIRELVTASAQKTLSIALLNGKQGAELSFGGSPWQLHMDWPIQSPPPPFPTPGIWHLGVYYGDD